MKKKVVKKGVFCWSCGHPHVYDPCPECGESKWSLEREIVDLGEIWKELFRSLKKGEIEAMTMEEIESDWNQVESGVRKILFNTMIHGRHPSMLCDCTKRLLLNHYASLDNVIASATEVKK